MLRPVPRMTRPAFRLLVDQKLSQELTLPGARVLHQRPLVHPLLVSRNLTSTASTFVSTSQLPTRGSVEVPQARSFTSTSTNFVRDLRSDDRRRGVVNRPLVGVTDDDLPRKDRKANPFLPFQASSFVDAFVTTVVGVGISESCRYGVGVKLNECSYSFRCRNRIPGVVQMEGPCQGMPLTRLSDECTC